MKQFGLIGFPLIHSFSKKYFSTKFESEQIDAVYDLYELSKIEEFTELINRVELSGLNVTIPYLKPHHQKALILGTGGASKAIEYVLRKLGIEVTFVSRTPKAGQITYTELNQAIIQDNLLIINASPVGTFPHVDECPAIPYEFIGDKHLLFDVVYNPAETLFLKKGNERSAATLNGEEMLQGQARAAWKIWNEEI